MLAQIEICLWVVITVALPAMVTDPKIAFFTEAQTGVVLAAGTLGSVVRNLVSQIGVLYSTHLNGKKKHCHVHRGVERRCVCRHHPVINNADSRHVIRSCLPA